MAISQYNRYPITGMTNIQIYTGTVSMQYRDTTSINYIHTSHLVRDVVPPRSEQLSRVYCKWSRKNGIQGVALGNN